MTAWATPATRLADDDRARAVRALHRGLSDGRLSADTFGWRVHAALRATNRRELRGLVADLPVSGLLARLVRQAGRVAGLLRLPPAAAVPATLLLPPPEPEGFTVGRNRDICDLVLAHRMVSSRHAELRHVDGHWLLTDLRSTNGTWLNGARLVRSAVVRPGDRVRFGDQEFVLIAGETVADTTEPVEPSTLDLAAG